MLDTNRNYRIEELEQQGLEHIGGSEGKLVFLSSERCYAVVRGHNELLKIETIIDRQTSKRIFERKESLK